MGKSKPSRKTQHLREYRKSGMDLSCNKRSIVITGVLILAATLALMINAMFLEPEDWNTSENIPENSGPSFSEPHSADDTARGRHKPLVTVQDGYFNTCNDCVKTVSSFGNLLRDVKMEPLVIRNHSIAQRWPIFSMDLLQMVRQHPNFTLEMSRWSTQPVFVLGQEREKGGMLGSPSDQPVRYTHITLYDFLASVFDPENWFYWTGGLREWEDQLLDGRRLTWDLSEALGYNDGWKRFISLESGMVFTKASGEASGEQGTSEAAEAEAEARDIDYSLWHPMLWLSHPSVVAQTHFDTQHNVFIQVQGYKTFLLFPPETELYSYPNIHRSYRQSQVHFEKKRGPSSLGSANSTRQQQQLFPLVSAEMGTTAFEVHLGPGDVLYIPPFWHHRVESKTLSVSLSVLSPSSVEAQFAQVYWENLPLGELQAARGLRSAAVFRYLSMFYGHFSLLEVQAGAAAGEMDSFTEFCRKLHMNRFAPLSQQSDADTARMLGAEMESYWAHSNISLNLPKLRSAAVNISSMLQRIPRDVAPPAVKQTFVRDYIEQIVRWAVGPQHTGSFIGLCLTNAALAADAAAFTVPEEEDSISSNSRTVGGANGAEARSDSYKGNTEL